MFLKQGTGGSNKYRESWRMETKLPNLSSLSLLISNFTANFYTSAVMLMIIIFLQECAANVVRRFLVKELVVMQWINFSISNVSFVIYVVSNMSVLILVSHPLGSSISCQSSNLLVVQHVWSTLTVSVGCVCTMDYMLQIEFLSSCFVWLFWLSW